LDHKGESDAADWVDVLAGLPLYHVLLFLPSNEAFSAGALCRALMEQTADGQGALRIWQDLLGDQCKGLQLSGGCLWLHALVPAASIAEYAPVAGRMRTTVPLEFRSAGELAKVTSAVRTGAGPGSVFFAAWGFDMTDRPFDSDGRAFGPVLSRPQHFRSEDGMLVSVRVAMVSEAEGEVTLAWRLSIVEDALEEFRDCRFELSGQVLLGVAGGGDLPSIRSFGISQKGMDAPASRLPIEGQTCTAILGGTPLVCSLRIRTWTMGRESCWGSFSVAAEP
jgi:hypothetical protein